MPVEEIERQTGVKVAASPQLLEILKENASLKWKQETVNGKIIKQQRDSVHLNCLY